MHNKEGKRILTESPLADPARKKFLTTEKLNQKLEVCCLPVQCGE